MSTTHLIYKDDPFVSHDSRLGVPEQTGVTLEHCHHQPEKED